MSYKIAIIEDDPAISQMYRMKFETEGYKVQTAENGKIGLDLIEKMKPNMVLLDLMMPEMNGDEMLEIMRATEWGKDIPVIVLTNMGEQEIPQKIEKLGINAFVLKAEMTPKQVEELVKKEMIK
jgi:DNA-binding response OmpR family regulator